uniref:Uncharacterized protein n=1 Tax=Micrurus lemniscatus lemniscatus TaxID=129467 RepID=A0A2D4J7S3_MICLE
MRQEEKRGRKKKPCLGVNILVCFFFHRTLAILGFPPPFSFLWIKLSLGLPLLWLSLLGTRTNENICWKEIQEKKNSVGCVFTRRKNKLFFSLLLLPIIPI